MRSIAALALVGSMAAASVARADGEPMTAMDGPHATPFADGCAAARRDLPAIRCDRVATARAGRRDVEVHQVAAPARDGVRLYVAIAAGSGWYVSAEPIEIVTRTISPMTSVTARGTVTSIDAHAVAVGGGPAVLVVVHEAWTLDCGPDCDAGYSTYATADAIVCGVGPSRIPSCTTPFDVRALGAHVPDVHVSRGALVVRGTDGDDDRREIDLP